MKNYFLFLLCCLIHWGAYSQANMFEVTHYLFPEFTNGVILLKSGEKIEALYNYNMLTEEMIYEKQGSKFVVEYLDKVDTAYVLGKKFFLLDNKWIELLLEGKYGLWVENKCILKDLGTPAAFGGTSQVSSSSSVATFSAGGQIYDLQLPDGYETEPAIKYWIEKDGKRSAFVTLRQLEKLFPEKNDLMKPFIKRQAVTFENQASLVKLVKYLADN